MPWAVLRRLFALLALLAGALASRGAEISVLAAASLSEALRDIAARHEQATGDKVRLNFAASSLLARQIKEGAPADVFFSADEAKMDDLAKAGLIEPNSRRSLLGNSLVVVVPKDSPLVLRTAGDLASAAVKHLALAETQTVPAGIYARAFLTKAGLWTSVAGRVVATENVRAALAAVESGNADAAIVYRTDALVAKTVKVAYEVPLADGPRITYPVALLKARRNPAGAAKFLELLESAEARAIFDHYGFLWQP